jgi:aminopeptidase N
MPFSSLGLVLLSVALQQPVGQQPAAPQRTPREERAPVRGDVLRGDYDRYRANNDLLSYHLDVRIDPVAKVVSGKNTIRFKMLSDDTRIQLDLYANLNVDEILLGQTPLKYSRDLNTVWVDFPKTLEKGSTYAIDFFYSGTPKTTGRFGGFTFGTDPAGRPWIYSSCEGEGAAIWWHNKDQWRDEVENMEISVSIPSDLVDVSNGRFQKLTDLGDGYTRWDWLVHYPINNYDVSVNIGAYVHFADKYNGVTMDFYALPRMRTRRKRPSRRPKACSRPTRTTSVNIPSRKTATSSCRCRTQAWSIRAP